MKEPGNTRHAGDSPWTHWPVLSLKAGGPAVMCSCYDAIWVQSTPVKCSCHKGWSDSHQPIRTHIHFKEIRGRKAAFKSHHKETIRHFQGWGTLQDNGCCGTRGKKRKEEENWLRLERLRKKDAESILSVYTLFRSQRELANYPERNLKIWGYLNKGWILNDTKKLFIAHLIRGDNSLWFCRMRSKFYWDACWSA